MKSLPHSHNNLRNAIKSLNQLTSHVSINSCWEADGSFPNKVSSISSHLICKVHLLVCANKNGVHHLSWHCDEKI